MPGLVTGYQQHTAGNTVPHTAGRTAHHGAGRGDSGMGGGWLGLAAATRLSFHESNHLPSSALSVSSTLEEGGLMLG